MRLLSILPRERAALERREDLQDLFAMRYHELLGWALQLTAGDRAAAEELVHDAYVDFARALPDLSTVGNLNGYLYTALRNLNHSRIRRAWKHRHEDLDVLEYDSLGSRLRWSTALDRVEMQEYILRLCIYLCWRKQTARSASILLLRFFRNYYPEDIAQLTHLSRNAVNVQILRARNEARAFLERPENFDTNPALRGGLSSLSVRNAADADVFLRRLSMVIRSSRTGECVSSEQLQSMLSAPTPPDTAQLAHLVSCDECLRKNPGSNGQRLSGGSPLGAMEGRRRSAKRVLADAEETVRELLDHQPSVLTLAVDGADVLECRVTAEEMAQVAVLPAETQPEFVEVFNHVGRRLLKIDVLSSPPDGPAHLSCRVPLAGCRMLEVVVEWKGAELRLHLHYTRLTSDGLVAEAELELEERRAFAGAPPVPAGGMTRWPTRVWRGFCSRIAFTLVPTVALALVLIGVVYLRRDARPQTTASASVILKRAVKAEDALNGLPDVSHRTLSFEERSPSGEIERSGRVEVWRDHTRLAKRLYDWQGELVAGEWKDGSGKAQHLDNRQLLNGTADCSQPTEAWACDLSAQTLEEMAPRGSVWKATETAQAYELTVESPEGEQTAPWLVRATLRLDRQSLHAREAHLWIRDHGATREYTYVEVSYERLPRVDNGASIFLPDPVLDQGANGGGRRSSLTPVTSSRLAHLQLQALSILDALRDDSGQPIQVERTRNGKLLIEGVVSSDAEARRVRAMFVAIATDPLVDLRVLSVEELKKLRKSGSSAAPELKSYEVEPAPRLADELLHAHFRSLGYRGDELELQVRQFCDDVLDQSASVLRLAWEMNDFNKTFTSREVAALPEPDKRTWFALLNRHVQAVSLHTAALEQKIAWMLPVPAADPANGPASPPMDTLPPAEMMDRTLRSATELNHALRLQLLASRDPINRSLVNPETISTALFDVNRSLTGVHALCMQYETLLKQP